MPPAIDIKLHTGTDPTVYMAKKKMKKKNDQEVIAKCDNPIDELHTGTDPMIPPKREKALSHEIFLQKE